MELQKRSKAELKALAQCKELITIRYKDAQKDTISILVKDGYPRNVGTAFSEWIQKETPKVRFGQVLSQPIKTIFTVVGVSRAGVKKFIDWSIKSCEGHGIASFDCVSGENAYTLTFEDREVATYFGSKYLIQKIDKHLTWLEYKVVDPKEFASILSRVSESGDMYEVIVKYVAEKTWTVTLAALKSAEKEAKRAKQFSATEDSARKVKTSTATDTCHELRQQFPALGRVVDEDMKARAAAREARYRHSRRLARENTEDEPQIIVPPAVRDPNQKVVGPVELTWSQKLFGNKKAVKKEDSQKVTMTMDEGESKVDYWADEVNGAQPE